jgi:hypothetical protein
VVANHEDIVAMQVRYTHAVMRGPNGSDPRDGTHSLILDVLRSFRKILDTYYPLS